MGRIDDLIQQCCPEGVEYVKFVDYANVQYGCAFDATKFTDDNSYIPLIRIRDVLPGKAGTYYTGEYSNDYIIKKGDILVGMDGNFNLGVWNDIDGLLNQRVCKLFTKNDSKLLNGFIKHYMKPLFRKIEQNTSGGSVKHLSAKAINSIVIPLPPLPIQEAIVEILDKFDRLSAELQAELQARKQQYEYYRNQLLTRFAPEQPVTEYSLGELGTFTKGAGILKSDFREQGYPCIHYGQVHTYYGTFAHSTKSFVDNSYATKLRKANHGDLIIASTSEDVEACCKACAWMGNYEVAVSGDAHIYSHNQNPKYMAYLFQTEAFAKQKRLAANGAKVVRVKGEAMAKFRFVFPSLEEQARIVAILDKFEALVNDLSQGLPAEIAAVQEQYEYYRNQLLTFKTKE